MAKRICVNTLIEPLYSTRSVPEHKLWWAVLKRAIVDYIKFFDYASHNVLAPGMGRRLERNIRRQMKEELFALNWFLYEQEVQPHNLSWIAEMCFEDAGFLKGVRRELLQIHLTNVREYVDVPKMKFLVEDYIDLGA